MALIPEIYGRTSLQEANSEFPRINDFGTQNIHENSALALTLGLTMPLTLN